MPVISTRMPAGSATRAEIQLPILLALTSGFLLNLPFPIAGPLPPGRAAFGWIALVPLMYALLGALDATAPRYLRRSGLIGYLCGVVWYILNCYWIYHTMHLYAGVPAAGAAGIVVLYSMVLGLYFGLFGLLLAFLRRASQGILLPLAMAPFLWAAIELAAAHITSVPWDQLGYSQVDNFWMIRIAPWTGVYGISFVLMAVNALFTGALLSRSIHIRLRLGVGAALASLLMQLGSWMVPKTAPTEALAVLLQPNFDVRQNNDWIGSEWDSNIAVFLKQSQETNAGWYEGMPEPSKPLQYSHVGSVRGSVGGPVPISLIAWPESPSPFTEGDPRFRVAMHELATETGAGIVAGNPTSAWQIDESGNRVLRDYNSASFISPQGEFVGRYNKIHLVPFGEYVPYRDLFFFAHHLTKQISDFSRGTERNVFTANGHRYGVFICYESIFADEIREFARNGAQVFVNVSDDGWYGDTSAPWQHLNMARMRAIENHRWILRDTNSGVTAAIDPQGRVVQSSPRHVFTSLPAMYGFRDDLTFYTRYGDVFAWTCVIIVVGAVAGARRLGRRAPKAAAL